MWRLAAVSLFLLPISGCGTVLNDPFGLHAPVQPPRGLLFNQYSAPLDFDFSDPDGTPLSGLRKGSSEASFIWEPLLGTSWAFGDAGIKTAADNARIEKVHYADYQVTNVLLIYTNSRIIVYGE